MKLNKKIKFGAAGVVALALVAAGASVASATAQVNGSDAPLYMYDTNIALVTDSSKVFGFEEDNFGSSGTTSYDEATLCPVESTGVSVFISPVGSERTVLSWNAYASSAFNPNPAVVGTKEVIASTLTPSTLINGNIDGVLASGGNYSLGVACTINNGVTVVGAFYRTIAMTAVTGAYTVTAVGEGGGGGGGSSTGEITLSATTIAAENGVLALTVPAGAAATFGTPTLVSGLSTTTGTLGAFTVNDGRAVTQEGWDLTANVTDFVNSADTSIVIGKTQLGLVPSVTSAGTTATGVTAAAAQVAGSASYPAAFASGAANNTVGDSVLNAGLTFVAPANKAAGTYTSTLTLTVVSK